MKKPIKKRRSIRIKMMGINISITLISFLLYGCLFILSISLLIGKYINSDMDFFLKEISDNINEKYEYMEDMIYATRESEMLMSFLKKGKEFSDEAQLKEEFARAVDISNSDNQRTAGEPVVEKVYLFRDDGVFISDFYYTVASSEINVSNGRAIKIWSEFQNQKQKNRGFYTLHSIEEGRFYIACSVMDDKMEQQGCIIFVVNPESIHTVMSEVNNYEGSFWMLYGETNEVLDGVYEHISLKEIDTLEKSYSDPYTYTLNGSQYRMFHRELGLEMKVMIGIPQNHASRILYDSLIIYIFMIFVILLVGILSFAIFTYKITKPVGDVTEKLKRVQEGDFTTKLPDYDNKEFHEISSGFNLMTTEINHLITEVYEKQIMLKELELKFLQSQLNPHFIFNVLNAIGLQARLDGNEQISRTISTFSQLIQAKVYRSDLEKVRIRQELEYAKYYLEIQKFRFGEKLSYYIDVDERLLDYYIQKLSIQLIVENAVVHGLEPKTESGSVHIRGCEEDGHIKIEIEDDGVGFPSQVELPLKDTRADLNHNQVGLNNIHAILQLRYGKEYGLTIETEKDKGSKVIIRIPFDHNMEEDI